MLPTLAAQRSSESLRKLLACAFLFFGVFWGPARVLPARACDKFVPFHNLCDRKCDICEREL